MDEIEYAVQGWVDDKRISRDHAYGIMISSGNFKNLPDKFQVFPLPYDDELRSSMSTDEITELYNQYTGLL